MKRNTKLVAVILCVCLLLTTLAGCGIDGTYYYVADGGKDSSVWIKIDGDTWEDSNGLYGEVTVDGDDVVLSVDIFGTALDVVTGTIDGSTFTCTFAGTAMVFEK